MTTNAAAASKTHVSMAANSKSIGRSRSLRAVLAGLCAVSMAGCETGSAMFGGDANAPAQALAPVQTPQGTPTRLALAPVIGAPDVIAKQLTAQLTSSIERQKVTIAKSPSERVDYTLRGYVVAAKEKSATKVSYIWDVTDNTGKRVHRITGEEIVSGAGGKDAWSSVSPALVQAVSEKTSASFGAWLATAPASTASAAPAAMASAPRSDGTTGATGLVQQASATSPVAATTLGAAGKIMVASPKVTGAPGDGNAALSGAMKRELGVKGVEVTEATVGTYRVLAEVKVKAKPDGNEAVSIDWIVNDPKGTRIATVTQNNDIPKGHLNSAWGQNADDAAKGASIQIKQVIADHSSGKAIKSSGSQTANAQ
jgi:hypothetical protein